MSNILNFLKSFMKGVFLFALVSLIIISQSAPGKFRQTFFKNIPETCAFPDFKTLSEQVNPFLKKVDPPNCSENLLTYVKSNENVATLFLKPQYLRKGFKCYREKILRGRDSLIDSNIRLRNRENFLQSIPLDSNPVLVTCKNGQNITYTNIHQAVVITEQIQRKINKSQLKNVFSVLIIGIDSVSRLNFLRSLPLTYKFLLLNDWLDFERYNKVEDNTYPNVMALLTGNMQFHRNLCFPEKLGGLENCPFIWKKFAEAGFITATAEDTVDISTFNHEKEGFNKTPTDYYFRPYFIATETFLPVKQLGILKYCTGPEYHGERMLNLIKDFTSTFRKHPTFSFFWMNSFSHNTLNDVGTMDSKILQFFEELKRNQVFDNTIIFFLSDHGLRESNFRETPLGWFEERLPFFFIRLPEKFQNTFKKEYSRIVENKRKFTSTYDVYMTLQHILKLSTITFKIRESTGCPRCNSLFTKIKSKRSCDDAGIDQEWCTCVRLKALNVTSLIVEKATIFMINKLNNIIIENRINNICSTFQLKDVVTVDVSSKENVLRLVIRTFPKAVFEGTISFTEVTEKSNWNFSGKISRIEKYAETSSCIRNKTLEPYCYCIRN